MNEPLKTDILGVLFDAADMAGALERAVGFLDESRPHVIVTPNPEICMRARKDASYLALLNKADLVVPDGVGVVYASKLNKVKLKSRVAGYDLTLALFARMQATGKTAYFFGSKPGVAEKAKAEIERRFPGLAVVGCADGYFDAARETIIRDDIKQKKPDVLLVGLGAPKQEMWIDRHKDELGCRVYIGCGGSLDGFAGVVPRAPKFWRAVGLEWLYRLLRQPSRITRMGAIPAFMWAVVIEKLKGNKK